jgi:hypothetical protein
MSASRVVPSALLVVGLAFGLGCGTSSVGLCAADRDCPTGSLCSSAGECVAASSPPGTSPDAGNQPPGPPPGTQCTPTRVDLPLAIPSVQFLLDQSGTMKNKFGSTDRFTAMRNALIDASAGVVTRHEGDARFGITLYTSHDGGVTCPILQSVPRDLGNASIIADVLRASVPDADNPLAEAIDDAIRDFAIDPPAAGPGVIIVATDGNADSCTNSNDGSGKDASVAATGRAHDAGLELYMVSIANGVDSSYLQQMANAGVGRAIRDVTGAPFFIASNQDGMTDAFDRIVRQVRCRLDAHALSSDDLADASVRLAGRTLSRRTEWDVLDARTIALFGAACDQLLAAPGAVVQAELACP